MRVEPINAPVPELIAALGPMPRQRGAYAARVHVGPPPDGALHLAAPAAGALDAWLAAEVAEVKGADDKLAAAYLLGSVAFALCEPLAALVLQGWMPRGLDRTAIVSRTAHWEENGETGEGVAYDVVFHFGALRTCADPATDLGSALSTLLGPLVDVLYTRSRLSRGALWRLVGDSLSGALLLQGKETQREDAAMDLATAILRDRQSLLHARQTGFFEVSLPERPEVREWFRARGGCCRHYTTEGGDYCTTCVLRDEDSRRERLQAYLRRKHRLKAA